VRKVQKKKKTKQKQKPTLGDCSDSSTTSPFFEHADEKKEETRTSRKHITLSHWPFLKLGCFESKTRQEKQRNNHIKSFYLQLSFVQKLENDATLLQPSEQLVHLATLSYKKKPKSELGRKKNVIFSKPSDVGMRDEKVNVCARIFSSTVAPKHIQSQRGVDLLQFAANNTLKLFHFAVRNG